MSWKAVQWAMQRPGLSPAERLVLIYVGDHAAHDGGSAYPSLATIASRTGLGERTVRRALAELVKAGTITVETVGGRTGGRGLSTSYRLPITDEPENPATVAAFPAKTRPNPTQNPATVAPQPKIEPKDRFQVILTWRPEGRSVDRRKVINLLWNEGVAWLLHMGARATQRQAKGLLGELLRLAGKVSPDRVLSAIQSAHAAEPTDLAAYLIGAVGARPPDESSDARRRRLLGLNDPLPDEFDGVTIDGAAELVGTVDIPPNVEPTARQEARQRSNQVPPVSPNQEAIDLLCKMMPELPEREAAGEIDWLLPRYGRELGLVIERLTECSRLQPLPANPFGWMIEHAPGRHPGTDARQ